MIPNIVKGKEINRIVRVRERCADLFGQNDTRRRRRASGLER